MEKRRWLFWCMVGAPVGLKDQPECGSLGKKFAIRARDVGAFSQICTNLVTPEPALEAHGGGGRFGE